MSRKKPRKRIKIKGYYMQVRQRSTKRGKKGTIMGKWKPRKEISSDKQLPVKPLRIKTIKVKSILAEIQDEKGVRLPSKTRKEVYEKTHKRCQCCGRPLRINQGEFHHLRKPTVKSRTSTIQFLCPTDHKLYGHEWKTTTKGNILGQTQKTRRFSRKRVRKHPSPYWEEKPTKLPSRKKKTRKKR